jgi:serine/threonine-protein kinase
VELLLDGIDPSTDDEARNHVQGCVECSERVRLMGMFKEKEAEIREGTVLVDRFEIVRSLGRGGMGEVFLARDRNFGASAVAVKVVRRDTRLPGDDEALRKEVELARAVNHPNVARVHDLHQSPFGPVVTMAFVDGVTLHQWIREKKRMGGVTADEWRRIARDVAGGLAAIHAAGIVHGDLKPGNVMVDRATGGGFIVDFGFAKERARTMATSRNEKKAADGGTPNYMSPERLEKGGASVEDDIYALGMTIWELLSAKVPEPGHHPPSHPIDKQLPFGIPPGLATDELKQIFRLLSKDPTRRPQARHLRFFNPNTVATNPLQVARERIDPGANPPYRGSATPFRADAQGLLITYASNARELIGRVLPLDKTRLWLGRAPSVPGIKQQVDLVVPEATISAVHCQLAFQANGCWLVEDVKDPRPSTNGIYGEGTYERAPMVTLLHGNEAMIGELRVKLVSFREAITLHDKALQFLRQRDGLTGLLHEEAFRSALDGDLAFARWAGYPLTLAWFYLRTPARDGQGRLTIQEMQALRRASKAAVDLFDMLLLSLTACTAGLTGIGSFAVALVGQTAEISRPLVEQVLTQMRSQMPPGVEVGAVVVEATEDHQRGADLLEATRRTPGGPVYNIA